MTASVWVLWVADSMHEVHLKIACDILCSSPHVLNFVACRRSWMLVVFLQWSPVWCLSALFARSTTFGQDDVLVGCYQSLFVDPSKVKHICDTWYCTLCSNTVGRTLKRTSYSFSFVTTRLERIAVSKLIARRPSWLPSSKPKTGQCSKASKDSTAHNQSTSRFQGHLACEKSHSKNLQMFTHNTFGIPMLSS